jgi:hypothetical protein
MMVDMREGWVLVFDMDQTITGNYFDVLNEKEELVLNPKIVEILKTAVQDKQTGMVSAIFLLTNNNDTVFIEHMEKELEGVVGKGRIFDYKMDANHTARTHIPEFANIRNGKQKSIADVEYMLTKLNKTTKNLINRLMFFDDQEHLLSLQLKIAGKAEHFVHVNPPFISGEKYVSKKYHTGGKIHKRKTRKLR